MLAQEGDAFPAIFSRGSPFVSIPTQHLAPSVKMAARRRCLAMFDRVAPLPLLQTDAQRARSQDVGGASPGPGGACRCRHLAYGHAVPLSWPCRVRGACRETAAAGSGAERAGGRCGDGGSVLSAVGRAVEGVSACPIGAGDSVMSHMGGAGGIQ